MISKVYAFLLMCILSQTLIAGDQDYLAIPKVKYSIETDICNTFFEAVKNDAECLKKEQCFVKEWSPEGVPDQAKVKFSAISTNQYGYTSVELGKVDNRNFEIIYLNKFTNDHAPRLLETWVVDKSGLSELLRTKPFPLEYKAWVKGGHGIQKSTLAPEFSEILSKGIKISDDWAPIWMPVFDIDNNYYFVGRECSGRWVVGSEYYCRTVIKVVVKKLNNNKIYPVCEFSWLKSQ